MKIRRLYEKKSNIDIFDYFRKKYEVDEVGPKILKLINKYLEINSEHFLDKWAYNSDEEEITDMRFEEPFKLFLYDKWKNTYELTDEEFNDLLNYVEDPKTYKNTKKYNL